MPLSAFPLHGGTLKVAMQLFLMFFGGFHVQNPKGFWTKNDPQTLPGGGGSLESIREVAGEGRKACNS